MPYPYASDVALHPSIVSGPVIAETTYLILSTPSTRSRASCNSAGIIFTSPLSYKAKGWLVSISHIVQSNATKHRCVSHDTFQSLEKVATATVLAQRFEWLSNGSQYPADIRIYT